MTYALLLHCSRAITRLSSFFYQLTNWLCLLLVLLTAEQVVARYFFEASSVGLQELEWHLFGAIFLLSAAHALHTDNHVRVDLFLAQCSKKTRAIIDLAGLLLFVLPISVIIIYYGFSYTLQAFTYVNPHPGDYYTAALLNPDHLLYPALSSIEGFFRETLLLGEISPDPGGLEARWIIKSMIPLGFVLIFLQGLAEIIRKIILIGNRE